jgi:hypothetical protein
MDTCWCGTGWKLRSWYVGEMEIRKFTELASLRNSTSVLFGKWKNSDSRDQNSIIYFDVREYLSYGTIVEYGIFFLVYGDGNACASTRER